MKKLVLVLSVVLCISSYLFAQDDVEKLIVEFQEKLAKTEKDTPEYKKICKVYSYRFENLRTLAVETYQFDKSKKIKEIMVSLDKGDGNISYTSAATKEEKKEAPEKKKSIPVAAHLKTTFSEGLTDKDGKPVSLEQLSGKYVGVYFSAQWCGPCRQFTPQLVKFRDQNEKDFEVVFVSSDNSESKRKEYMAESNMKWPTVKFKGENGNSLDSKFSVNGIPALIILSPSGEVVTKDGRSDVSHKFETAIKNWKETKK